MRLLTFGMVLAMVLRNGVKSLQNAVSEALSWLGLGTASASAYSQARYKLKHAAFVELNRQAVVETLYGDGEYRRFRGFRVLAVDGSKVALPDTPEVREEFGSIAYTGGKDNEVRGERPWALASVLYDVLNRVALDAVLARGDAYEVDLAVGHLARAVRTTCCCSTATTPPTGCWGRASAPVATSSRAAWRPRSRRRGG